MHAIRIFRFEWQKLHRDILNCEKPNNSKIKCVNLKFIRNSRDSIWWKSWNFPRATFLFCILSLFFFIFRNWWHIHIVGAIPLTTIQTRATPPWVVVVVVGFDDAWYIVAVDAAALVCLFICLLFIYAHYVEFQVDIGLIAVKTLDWPPSPKLLLICFLFCFVAVDE